MIDVQVLADTANHFVAEEPPNSFSIFLLLPVLVIAGAALYAIRQGSRKTGMIMISVTALLAWTAWPNGIAYRMDLNSQERVLHVETLKKGEIIESQAIQYSDIARVEVQFNRGDKRIVVVLNNGKEVFPLGDGYIRNDPNQYKPLIAIQKAVGLPILSDSDK